PHHTPALPGCTAPRHRSGRKPCVAPRREPTDDVCDLHVSETDEHACREHGRVAVVAEDDDAPLDVTEVWVAPRAARLEPPFEHGAGAVDRSRDDSGAFAVVLGA